MTQPTPMTEDGEPVGPPPPPPSEDPPIPPPLPEPLRDPPIPVDDAVDPEDL